MKLFVLWTICMLVHGTSGGRSRSYAKDVRPKEVVITIKEDQPKMVAIDLCNIIHCGPNSAENEITWNGYDVYGCLWPAAYGSERYPWCPSWDKVQWSSNPSYVMGQSKLKEKVLIRRGHKKGKNPIIVSIKALNGSIDKGLEPESKILIEEKRRYVFWITIGVDISGIDPLGMIKVVILKQQVATPTFETGKLENTNEQEDIEITAVVKELNAGTFEEAIAIETGYSERNEWLEWVKYTAETLNTKNCYVCAAARPNLATFPAQGENSKCLVKLFSNNNVTGCDPEEKKYPAVKLTDPGGIIAYKNNYTCVQRNVGNIDFKKFEVGWCGSILKNEEFEENELTEQNVERADLWWLCGDMKLRRTLKGNWKGECALVNLIMPFSIIKVEPDDVDKLSNGVHQLHRSKRESKAPGGTFDNKVWIDHIGVPRGIPDEFKARNQIAAGFESVFFWWVTINKNVDWINYLYYNQQRFVNFTRDAVRGMHEQLDKTSMMTIQNRIALDMLLAERGGVCKIIGPMCCTFIPNNTAPDGSITRALQGLDKLSNELAENAGIDNPITRWMEKWFGKWSGIIGNVLIAIICTVGIVGLCGCCCIPCIRSLAQKTIETSMTKMMAVKLEKVALLNNEQCNDDDDVYYVDVGDDDDMDDNNWSENENASMRV